MGSYWPEQDVYEAGRRSLAAKKHAPSKKLLAYLTEFQQDELTTGTIDRPTNFAVHHENLVAAMRKKFPEHGYRQVIRGSGLDTDVPKFWELVFAMYYVTHEIEIINNIGFESLEIATGISTARKIPHAEFKIMDEQLRREVSLSDSKHQVKLTLQGKVLKLVLDGQPHVLKRYKSTDVDTYRACHKLTQNPDKPLKRDGLGVKGDTQLKHLLSNMGFKDIIREIFIDHDEQNRTLTLTKSVELDDVQYAAVREYLVKLSNDKNNIT